MLEKIADAVGLSAIELRYGSVAGDAGMPDRSVDNVHHLAERAHIRTLGEVAANVWRGVESADQEQYERADELLLPPDPRYGTGRNRPLKDPK